jgi:hypothetical protein
MFGFELVENGLVGEGDGNFGISGWGVSVIVNVGDIVIVWGEGFEDVVVIVEIEGDGVSQCFSP